jgi:superfamily I DNA/RNA helicase
MTNINVGEWSSLANVVLDRYNESLKLGGFQVGVKKSIKNYEYREMSFRDVFGNANDDEHYTMGTVHSIKGRTFEAVLLILKERSAGKKYTNMLYGTLAEEEMRIIYVAITRPRRILVIATPEGDRSTWIKRFQKKVTTKSLFDF